MSDALEDADSRYRGWIRFKVILYGVLSACFGGALASDLVVGQDPARVDVNEPPQSSSIISSIEPTAAHIRWAEETYILPDMEYGYQKFEFVSFDMGQLMTELRKSPLYLAAIGDNTSITQEPARAVDLWLNFFGEIHPLKFNKVSINTVDGTKFINVRGHIADVQDIGFGSIPGPYSWRLHINEADANVVGQIDTTSHRIAIQTTPDRKYTMVAWVSRENLAKFPPID